MMKRSRMRKGGNATSEQTRKAFALAQKAGIRSSLRPFWASRVKTAPNGSSNGQLSEEIKATYAFFGVPTPFPGSTFGKMCEENNWIKVRDWTKYTVMNAIIEWPGGPTLLEQTEMVDKAYRAFYNRPGYWLGRLLYELPRLDWPTIRAFMLWSGESISSILSGGIIPKREEIALNGCAPHGTGRHLGQIAFTGGGKCDDQDYLARQIRRRRGTRFRGRSR